MSWMKLSTVLDESVFGQNCFRMSFVSNLDENVPNKQIVARNFVNTD